MADPFLAEIRMFGFNFAPNGWAACDGAVMPISQNTALFSLLGTNYGGDGRSTFQLPNLQSSLSIGVGQGPGLSPRVVGETGGAAAVTLQATEMPAHRHVLMAGPSPITGQPLNANLAPTANGATAYRIPGVMAAMAPDALQSAGGSQPHQNRQPYVGLMFCIALQGIFPPRS
ncbi:MAG TPA: tail fiber protein [Rhodoferax sp.]